MNRKLRIEELNRLSVAAFKEAEKTPIYVVLDNVRSLANVGTIFRTADGFRISGMMLCGITARPPHREITKTALGATESVAWSHEESTLEAVQQLQQNGVKVLAVEQTADSEMLDAFEPNAGQAYAFVFGHEVNGVSQDVVDQCDGSLEIPQFGTKHSFNVSISAGIVLWEVWRKQQRAGR